MKLSGLCPCFSGNDSTTDSPRQAENSSEAQPTSDSPSARILITMGSCGVAIGQLQCPCPGGTAQSGLGQDAQSLRCSLCEHLMSDHSDYVAPNQDASPSQLSQAPVAPRGTPEQLLELSSDFCPRKDTVSKLADLIAEWTVVHVRGTPSSGKTILAKLLRQYYLDKGLKCVFITGWSGEGNESVRHCIRLYESEYGQVGLNDWGFFALNDVLFIIDEAQETYTDQLFWLSVLKSQSARGYGPRFCLFSSYGSPSTGLSALTMRSTPVRFGWSQRVSLVRSRNEFSPDVGLFYTEDEFRDAVQRLVTLPDRSAFSFDNDALSYLFSVTNGHPAAVTALVNYIYKAYRAEIKHGHIERIGKSGVLKLMEDDAGVLSELERAAIGRSFPYRNLLTVDAANVLRETLENRNIYFDENNQGLSLCYKMGWLQVDAVDRSATEVVCVFPSRIHEKFVEINLASDYKRPFPLDTYPTIAGLCEHVLKNFSKSQLQLGFQGRVSTSGKCSNPESQFQDEFYRSFTNLLGHGIGISSEWSKDADGRIDFHVTDPEWGVELLRDGDRLSEHCRRFAPMGAYGGWISSGHLKDWLIIDCRHSEPKPTNLAQHEPKLWRVVFKDEYTRAYVLNCDNEIVVPEFPLLE